MTNKLELILDLREVFEEFELLKSQQEGLMKAVVQAATSEVVRQWKSQAMRALGSTRKNYLMGIKVVEKGRFANAVVLTGRFNNMIENGISPFDMKEGFKKSKKAKISKSGGWYLTIPFRWATPGALGESEAFSGIMPEEIHEIVKRFKATKTMPGGTRISTGLGLKDIPEQYAEIKSRPAVGSFGEYVHKSSIYEGIMRSEKDYEKATQSTYTSFRRVSGNSDKLSFIHSGIKQYDLASKAFAATDFETTVENATDLFISKL